MKRNDLVARSLTLGLAVATAAASMSTPGGLMAPVTVQAEAGGASETQEKDDLTTTNIDQYFKLDPIAILSDGSATADIVNVKGTDATGTVTVLYQKEEETASESISNASAKDVYKVLIKVAGGTELNETSDDGVLLGTITLYAAPSENPTITYKVGDRGTTAETVQNSAVTISAEGYTVGADEDGLSSEPYEFTSDQTGEISKNLLFKKGEAVSAKKITLKFDVDAPAISNVEVTNIGDKTATVTVTATDKTVGESSTLTYKLTQSILAEESATSFDNTNGEFSLLELSPNTEYSYTLTVTDEAGNVATYENPVTFTTLKSAFVGTVSIKKSGQALAAAPVIGDELTADVADGQAAENYNFQWYRQKDEEEAVAIEGAEDSTYTVDKADFGYKLSATAVLKDGNSDKGTSDPTSAVVKKPFAGTEPSSLTYDSTEKKLTATVTEGTSAADYEYVLDGSENWIKGDALNSKLSVSNTTATLDLGNVSYAANSIKIRVAATDEMLASTGATYEQEIKAGLEGSVSITGTPKYNEILTAETSGTQDGASLSYQWLRADTAEAEGTVIDSATEESYKLTADDIGKYIKVKVTASNYEGEKIATTTTTIAKADAREVKDITVASKVQNDTKYTYTLNTQAGSGAKYAYVEGTYESVEAVTEDNGTVNWVENPAFENLEPITEYTFFATYAEDPKYQTSAVKVLNVTTDKLKHAPLSLNVTVSGEDEKTVTITSVEGAEYKFTGEDSYSATNMKTYTSDEINTTPVIIVEIRYPEDAKYENVTPLTQTLDLTKKTQEAPTWDGDLGTAVSADKKSYKLTFTAPTGEGTFEYSLDGVTYGKTEDQIKAMTFGANETITVYVRKAAITDAENTENDANASSAVMKTVTTPAASATPEISGDSSFTGASTSVTITAADNAEIYYSTDGNDPVIDAAHKYADAISVTATTTIKAVAVENGKIVSAVASKLITKSTSTTTQPVNPPTNGSTWTGPSTTTPSTDDKKPETKPETKPENQPVTETKADGTKVTTTETKAADGSVTAKVELKNETTGVVATVKVAKDADGKVTDATAAVTQTSADKKAGISAATVAQITEAAGTKAVEIKAEIVDESGNTVCRLTANAEDLKAGNKLKVLKYDSKTGDYVLVNKTTYKVDKDGNVAMNDLKRASYMVVTASEAEAFSKQVLKTVKVETAKKNVTAGKKTKITLDDGLNMANVAKITYKTSRKSVATVNKNGTITTKKAGTVTVRATVTLKNGKTKSVKMTLTVKKAK